MAALGTWLPWDAVLRCREVLEIDHDLARYTSSIAADDLDDVRRALGYDEINLDASSYGTRLAQVYIRRHGEHVRSAVLKGVAGVEDLIPLDFARFTQRAMDRLLALCLANRPCAERFPDPKGDLRRALERFETGPVDVTFETQEDGVVTARLHRHSFTQALRYLLYGSESSRRIPLILQRAAAGDFTEPARFLLGFRGAQQTDLWFGLFFSVTCSEDLPFIDEREAVRRAQGTFLGVERYQQQARACSIWPAGPVPQDLHETVRTDVPLLMLSGELDPATPPERAEEVTRHFSRRAHLVVPGGGHFGAAGAECVSRVVEEFLDDPEPEAVRAPCLDAILQPAFAVEP